MTRKRTPRRLNPRQALFVQEYLKDFNSTQAAKRAGYPVGHTNGPRLLKIPAVAFAIEEARSQLVTAAEISTKQVLDETKLLAFSDLTHYVVDDDGQVQLAKGAPEGAMRAISSIKRRKVTRGEGAATVTTWEVEIRLWDKPGTLKLAGQHVGLFRDKVEHSGPDGGPLVISWADE